MDCQWRYLRQWSHTFAAMATLMASECNKKQMVEADQLSRSLNKTKMIDLAKAFLNRKG